MPGRLLIFLAALALVGCTQLLGIEEGRLEGTGGGGSSAQSTTGSSSTSTNGGCNDAQCGDDNPCTAGRCQGDSCVTENLPLGLVCGAALQCDGMGSCVGCVIAADCGEDTACEVFSCDDGVCSQAFLPDGTLVSGLAPGDCRHQVCNGTSALPEQRIDASDVPPPGICTMGACSPTGTPHQKPDPAKVLLACADAQGNGICDPAGECSSCQGSGDCSSSGFGLLCGGASSCRCSFLSQCNGPNTLGAQCSATTCGCSSQGDCSGKTLGSRCDSAQNSCGCANNGDCMAGRECGPTAVCIPIVP